MKNNVLKVILLSTVLLVVSFIVIFTMGKTYTLKYNIENKESYTLTIDDTSLISVISEKTIGNKYIVKVKGINAGKSFIMMDYGDMQEERALYIHKSMIITDDNYFGYSTGSEIIPISISIVLVYVIYLLIMKYRNSVFDNIFQYKNVAYLGIIIFLSNFALINIISIFDYRGLFDTINTVINSSSTLSFILFPLAFITFILVSISNIKLIKKEGKNVRNLLGLFLGILICLLTVLPNLIYSYLLKSQIINIYNLNSPGPYIYNFIETLIYLIVAYLECVLIATIVVSILSVKRRIDLNKDYIIILGCQIFKDGTLTPLLKGRVDKALEFRNNQLKETHKDLIFIPSGGKGEDEVISEAQAINNYLIDNGIDENNILIDDKSTSTYENIMFSNKLIKDENAKVAFSTTNYHVFRAGLLATSQGLKLDGIGSKTKSYFWINAFIREFVGTLYSEKKKHILVFLLIVIFLIIMIYLTYLSNNL